MAGVRVNVGSEESAANAAGPDTNTATQRIDVAATSTLRKYPLPNVADLEGIS
jgi:hypothetical protein